MLCSSSLYTELEANRNQIRLLALPPGQHHDTIVCHLKIVSLEAPGEYEALSYAWGGSFDDREDIEINGLDRDVGHNLAQALRHLRLADKERVLWVDALCINQDDVSERTEQVRLMRDIYRSARRTVVWLGDFASLGRLAMDLIRHIAINGVARLLEPSSEPARRSLQLILGCSWWQRTWVIQELTLSRDDPLLYCGRTSLLWSHFVAFRDITTSAEMQRNSVDLKWQQFATNIVPLNLIKNWQADQRSWSRLVLITTHYRATDPRDRLFALHGLLSRETQRTWLPDYNLSVSEVFTDFTKYMIEKHGLKFLCFDKPKIRTDLPSWVPDYSTTSPSTDAGISGPSEELTDRIDARMLQFVEFGGKVLRLEGHVLGIVHEIVPSVDGIGLKAFLKQSHDIRQNLCATHWGRFPGGGYSIQRNIPLAEILGCRRSGYRPQYAAELTNLLEHHGVWDFEPEMEHHWEDSEQKWVSMLEFMYQASRRHRFFTTSSAFCGMGHPHIQEGDRIFLPFDCTTQLIIRKTSYEQHSIFIGTCDMPISARIRELIRTSAVHTHKKIRVELA